MVTTALAVTLLVGKLEPSFRDLKQFRSFGFRFGLFRGNQSLIPAVAILIGSACHLGRMVTRYLISQLDQSPNLFVSEQTFEASSSARQLPNWNEIASRILFGPTAR